MPLWARELCEFNLIQLSFMLKHTMKIVPSTTCGSLHLNNWQIWICGVWLHTLHSYYWLALSWATGKLRYLIILPNVLSKTMKIVSVWWAFWTSIYWKIKARESSYLTPHAWFSNDFLEIEMIRYNKIYRCFLNAWML